MIICAVFNKFFHYILLLTTFTSWPFLAMDTKHNSIEDSFITACIKNDIICAKKILDTYKNPELLANCNTYHPTNTTIPILNVASKRGYIDIVKLLIHNGARINAKNSYGETALHGAIFLNHYHVAQELIESGANIDAKEAQDWTPAHYAAFLFEDKIFNLLMEHGANNDATNVGLYTPSELASSNFKNNLS
jgi:ankyrin repeat protein